MKEKIKQKIKQEILYKEARYLSNSHAQPHPAYIVYCSTENIKYYANTPNTIIYFRTSDKEGFFRECRKHLERRAYLDELLSEYCRYVYINEHSEECLEILRKKLKNKMNFEQFFGMGAGTAQYTNITKFRQTLNPEYIGISKPYPGWFENQLLQLVQYAWGALEEYKYNAYLKLDEYHTYNSNRTYVTKLVAELIGADQIVPNTEYASMVLDGEQKYGVVVGVASGMSPEEALEKGLSGVSPEFQRQSLILNVADIICYQKDHRPGNYFITLDENNRANAISAFDNDCPTTLMCSNNISFGTYLGCSSIVNCQGYINRPYLDKHTSMIICGLKKEEIEKKLQGHLSRQEMNCLVKRVKKLQVAIKKSITAGKLQLLDIVDWNKGTIEKELKGNYGKTYLKLFIVRHLRDHNNE